MVLFIQICVEKRTRPLTMELHMKKIKKMPPSSPYRKNVCKPKTQTDATKIQPDDDFRYRFSYASRCFFVLFLIATPSAIHSRYCGLVHTRRATHVVLHTPRALVLLQAPPMQTNTWSFTRSLRQRQRIRLNIHPITISRPTKALTDPAAAVYLRRAEPPQKKNSVK